MDVLEPRVRREGQGQLRVQAADDLWWKVSWEAADSHLVQSVQLLPRKLDDAKANADGVAAPGEHLSFSSVQRLFHSCSSMLNECCRQTAQCNGTGEDADPFHDPRLVDDRSSTRIGDMMACFQAVARWSPETNAAAAILALRLSTVHAVSYGNCERVMMTSLLLAQKLVDDQPLLNADFPELCQIWDKVDRSTRHIGAAHEHLLMRRTRVSLQQVNALELLMLQKLNFNVYVDFADALYVLMVSLPLQSDQETTAETHQMMDLVTKRARTPGPPVPRSPSGVWEALPAGFGTSGAACS